MYVHGYSYCTTWRKMVYLCPRLSMKFLAHNPLEQIQMTPPSLDHEPQWLTHQDLYDLSDDAVLFEVSVASYIEHKQVRVRDYIQ